MDIISNLFGSRQENWPSFKDLKRNQFIEKQLEELIQKPHRRIRKLADIASPDSDNIEVRELYESLPRFGPFYINGEDSFMKSLKKATWQHVISLSPTTEAETVKIYMSAMRRINIQARNTYEEGTAKDHSDTSFFKMMIEDGCFILQLALFLLGGSAQLKYPPDHLIFGENRNTDTVLRKWIRSMFFVGNQIPQVVLKELMTQNFFEQVLSSGKWERPSDLFRQVLHDSLLLPVLESRRRYRSILLQGFKRPDNLLLKLQPSDLLHGLHLLVIGTGNGSIEDENEEEEGDLERDGEDFAVNIPIRSATELKQAGISFKKISRGIGIGGIKFTTSIIFRAVLELPTFEFDEDTEWLFAYLTDYEITQQLGRNRREVGSYLQLMSELILTPGDAKLLSTTGIIQANRNQREKLPKILKNLANGDTTQNLRIVRLQIEDYSRPPWKKIKNFLSLVLLLTLVQTVYTVLEYYRTS